MTKMLSQLASLLPGILALVTALLVSVLIAWALSAILRRSLAGFEFDRRVAQWGLPAVAEWSPSSSPTLLVTRAIAWIIILMGFLIGISAFDGALPSQFVVRLFAYLPDVMAAIVVLVAGSIIARFLARSVLIGAVNMNLQYARLLSVGVKWLVTVLAVTIAHRASRYRRRHHPSGIRHFVRRNCAGIGSGRRSWLQGTGEQVSRA